MARFFGIARDSAGNTIAAPHVTVLLAGGSTPASIYSNAALTSALPNPFAGNADGTYSFYASPGSYKLRLVKPGYATFELDDVALVGAALDHGSLSGLADDDHPAYVHSTNERTIAAVHTFAPAAPGPPFNLSAQAQGLVDFLNADLLDGLHAAAFPLLAGRGGGQTLRGGTASADNLNLASTTHATKGKILLGTGSAFDESTGRLGIGTTTPTQTLELLGNLLFSGSASRTLQMKGGSPSAAASLQVEFPEVTTGPALFRLFLNTNTSGVKRMEIFRGDATSTVQHSLASGEDSSLCRDNGNLALFGTGSFGSGSKVLYIANRTAAPSSAPAGGGVLYVESGALKYRGSSGTTTTLAAA